MINKTILYINSSNTNKVFLSLFVKNKLVNKSVPIRKGEMSNNLLLSLQKLLESNSVSLSMLDAICVYSGPGPYTSLRVGISTANTLAWVLNIPIYCIKDKQIFSKNAAKIAKKAAHQLVFTKPAQAYYQQAV